MNPQDDPEARIRDLERPLADVARTSELGTQHSGGYVNAPPPPPPPGYYGTPPGYGNQFPGATPRVSGGFSWWWLIIATFAIGGLAVGAGVAVFGTNLFSSDGSTSSSVRSRPNVSGGGTLTTVPTSGPSTSSAQTEAPTGEPSASALPPGASVSVGGFGANKTIACNDNMVSIAGSTNTVVITGHCVSVNVSGMDNIVTVDSADTIVASGIDNRVTFRSGSPEITKSGFDNVVEQG